MTLHLIGVGALVLIFVIGTWRPVNIGALALIAAFVVGVGIAGLPASEWYRGFPVDLLVLLVAVTWLFALAARNGTIEWLVNVFSLAVGGRRALVPWIVFVVAAIPTTAGALGSAGVALLAPLALRLAERYDIDRRLIALMVLHGAACGNFSPLNVLGAIVHQGAARTGTELSSATLFLANVIYNIGLGAVVYLLFKGHALDRRSPAIAPVKVATEPSTRGPRVDRILTLLAIASVATASLLFDLGIGVLALVAVVALTLAFPRPSHDAHRDIAWDVVLLVCGIVTYVALLQRLGTVDVIGHGIADLGSPLAGALLLCVVGAVTSAFASSAGILGAMMVLAAPFMALDGGYAAGFVVALAISATVVDSCPFSTAGALVVANTRESERARVYRALLAWGAVMAVTAPLITWLIFVVPAG